MAVWPSIFLLGLLPLLGQVGSREITRIIMIIFLGADQIQASSGRNTLEGQLWPESLGNFPFPCNPMKSAVSVPSESVHTLRPSDIKFVAAIGNLEIALDSRVEDLGEQLGAEKVVQPACVGVMTVLSDIVSHFNPAALTPRCPAETSVVLHHGGAEDLWAQAQELVRSMKENQELDFQRDWKLINVFFSNTSQCFPCPSAQQMKLAPQGMDKLMATLDYLQQEVPRAYVNLVDLSELAAFSRWRQASQLSPATKSCSCLEETSQLAKVLTQWSYLEAWDSLLATSKYNKQESFAVVFQPFFYETSPSLLSAEPPLQDPSTLALSLWNKMMEPVGRKEEPFSERERRPLKCPSQENPYLFTYGNSKQLSRSSQPKGKLEVREGTELRCPDKDPSNEIPTSVHRLKPADIKVIGAMGDSLTAGNGAGSLPGNVLDVITQYRGLSWSVGGDQNISTVTTLANILREFNPSLQGFSVGTGRETTSGAFFNQAVAGARADGLVAQAQRLVTLMKNDTRINFQEDWKVITVFIGGNDLCDSCNDPARYSPQNFTDNIAMALDILHAEVPRAFVNLVEALEISKLRELYQESRVSCPRLILRSLCPCVLRFDDNSTELATLIDIIKAYQNNTQHLIDSGRYDSKDDFTVVLQPFFENVNMPKTAEGLPDSSYFAPDCFHFSSKAHAHAASALWNNMLEPVGQKTRENNFEGGVHLSCPNQVWPFLSTYKNSEQAHGTWLPCTERSSSGSRPTSVHALRPADIQVVAALGDSLTAGNGIASKPDDLADVVTQYRGLSFSSGGDDSLENVTTLPNILRQFNSGLVGYAVGTGDASTTNAFLNQAVPGAKAGDLVSQVQALIQRMKTDHRINFQEDWKVITVQIGGSDLCDYCTDSNLYSATNFIEHLRDALDVLHSEVPRAFVNLVDFMSPSVIRQVFLGNLDTCPVKLASALCNCVLSPRENSYELTRLEALAQAYQSGMRELVESGRYDTREDFTVVLQPLFHDVRLPVLQNGSLDRSFFAPDCIHPNQKFHSWLSRSLWRNMLEPLGGKTDILDLSANLALACPTQNQPFLRTFQNSDYTYPTSKPAIENWGSDLQCTTWRPSKSDPSSVHELHPAHIKVVAALGDSLTLAIGARPSNTSDLPVYWRGLSWSIGGDGALETHTTLPNILKKFNPSILGFSTGTLEETMGLNVAVPGARAQDMPAQARDLVERMRNNPEINLEKDWKLVTLLVGGNDLCHFCENPGAGSEAEYIQYIQQALDILYAELPRTFVNVVEVMELAGLHQDQGGKCATLLAAQSQCTCFRYSQSSPEMQELKKMNWNLQSGLSQLSYTHQYVQRKDFTVVVQPFLQNTLVPLTETGDADLTFFSEDCFHFSERSHAEMAIALWNNMLEPVGHKTTSSNFTYSRTKLKCPSPESPYLYTLRNSQLLPDQAEAAPTVLYWAVPVAAGAGLLIGILAMVVWTAVRKQRNPSVVMATGL
ncbi:phospholipase B1, membrane-associated [Ochotona curzoniae]|uniref:phospholipase B1, membrane-associated n=1 Tax=Ochotona curzoniae TaxID=130825 RepID=UPI001B352DD0|nr:phospholipase B1, membrane-associated [Ochotona curzoniae]